MGAIELEHVTQRFGDIVALSDVSVTFAENRITGLLGRNGSGKSTLLDLVSAHRLPTSGEVRVSGRQPFESRDVLRQVCAITEAQSYPGKYSVSAVLRAASWLYPTWDAALADDLADQFGLRQGQLVDKLSRGQRSAVGVIIGLASRSPVTLLDEPYVGLDAVARQLFYDRLLEAYADQPRTIVLSSHLIDEVADLLEHVVVLDAGRVVADVATDDLRYGVLALTGPTVVVDDICSELEVLHRTALAGTTRVLVRGADAGIAARLGLRAERLTLQQVVVAMAGHQPPPADAPAPRTIGALS
ncbi:MAG: ABC transporter ATP-binding protein [Phycicoccus sp.]|nr:ABC transporter ATP-binding protein [Phycicoccus sp.]